MLTTAIALVLFAAPPGKPAPAATPKPIELTDYAHAQQLVFRGSFDSVVSLLEPLTKSESPSSIIELSIAPKGVAQAGAVDLEVNVLFAKTDVLPKLSSPHHPMSHRRRLEALSRVLPKRAWLDGYTQVGDTLNIKGHAVSTVDIADFMKA